MRRGSPLPAWLLVWLSVWWCGPALGGPGGAVVLGAESQQALGAYLGLLDDPAGTLDLAAVQRADAAGKFRPAPPNAFSLGHLRGATWVRFVLANPGAERQERWLHVNWINQQSYILYLDGGRGTVERMESGARIAIPQRPLASRLVLFPFRLEPGATQTAYLRIAGRAITVVDLALWQPAALLDHLALSNALKYLGVGASGIVMVFGFLAFRARRRPGLLAIIPAQALTVLIALWMDGYAVDWLPADDGFWFTRGLVALVFMMFFCHILFARSFLGLARQFPWLDRGVLGLAASCPLMAVLQLSLDALPSFHNLAILGVSGALTGVALLTALWKGKGGLTYLVIWGGFWIAVSFQIALNQGWLDGGFSNDLWLVGLIVSGLALTYALYRDVESTHTELRAAHMEFQVAQTQLLAHKQRESDELVRAVADGTAEMREAMARAEEASQAKSAFLSMVSHELRTPLHTILGYASLLGKRAEGEMFEQLAIIEKSGAQLLHLIDEVLYYSRGESRPMVLAAEPVGLRALALYLEDTGRLLAEKNYNRFVVELAPNLPETVETDEARLTQVLLNLVDNACKYTEFGRVSLRIAAVDHEEPVAAGWRRLWFEVEDNGVGIALADQARVFEPFSRGGRRDGQGGVGLGLTIAQQIVRAMNGEIGLDSGPGRGSRFYFTLCLKEVAAGSREFPALGRIVGYAGPRLALLVVDDIALNRKLLGDLCRAWNFDVVMAADGAEAAALCQGTDPPIAAALVDQFMPRADGWAFLANIRGTPALAHLPLILVSATLPERPPDIPAGFDFDRVLTKPVTPDQLADTLRAVLGLEWLREAVPSRPVAGRCVPPPMEKLVEFRKMLALGQVLALRRWAESLAASHPEYAEFAKQVGRLSQAIDLAGLNALLERVSAEAETG